MFKGDTIPGILFILFGLIFMFPSLALGLSSATSDGVPGAGFFPFLMSIMVIIFGILIVIRGIKAKGRFQYFKLENDPKENIKIFLITTCSILIFLILWKVTSFLVASVLISLFLNYFYKRSIKFNILYTLIFIGMIYLVFGTLLRIQFVI